jgi:signal transduction histidine kinase/ActR/RegA family two-component response regulator
MAAVVIAAISGTLAIVSENVSDRQENQLVKERAAELASLLSLSLSDIRSMLQNAGTAALDPARAKEFRAITTLASANPGTSIVVARREGSDFEVIDSAGSGAPAGGTRVGAGVASIVDRAPSAAGNLVSGVTEVGPAKHAVIAMAINGSARDVVYYESVISGAATPAPADADSPYHELDVAVYAGRVADPDQLVMISGDVPNPHRAYVDKQFKIGVDTWTLRISARSPLVGSLANLFPWLVAVAGLALAVFVGLVVLILVRRRAYALRLVEERTRLLQEAQRAAERANRAKSDFLSRMSHELRTPLNAVLGFAQLLEMDGLTPEQADSVTQIRRGGSYLLDLINEILDISRIESGKLSISPEPVRVAAVVDAAIDLVGPLAAERGVNLIRPAESDADRFVFADQQRLKQILLNLLSNGIKYNRSGGSVSISCFEPTPGLLRIQVTDTGPGIPEDKRDLLFVPFERLGAEDTQVEGTGVGLALSRGLARAMGGRLEVDTTFGRGSTFWVELPLVQDPISRSEQVDDSVAARVDDRLQVLHIEDNPANIALVERVLAQRPDLVLAHATSARHGLEFAQRERPALVLLDLNLPDGHGAEVLKELRADPRTAAIPVIVISADAMPRQMQRLLSAGAAAYLTKPIDIRDLLCQVDDVLGLAAAR